MLERLFNEILQFKEFAIMVILASLLLVITIWSQSNKFSWTPGRLYTYRIFSLMDKKQTVMFALLTTRTIYILSMVIFCENITIMKFVGLMLIVAPFDILALSPKLVIGDVFSNVAIFGAVFTESIMYNYLNQIYFDVQILITIILLGIFLCTYTLYMYFATFEKVLELQEARNVKGVLDEDK